MPCCAVLLTAVREFRVASGDPISRHGNCFSGAQTLLLRTDTLHDARNAREATMALMRANGVESREKAG